MNKNESKYFNTAIKMDQAFLELLEKKDFAYITVKEICHEAGVNRSTFYLHYETLDDLLKESVEYMNRHFLEHMGQDSRNFVNKINDCSKDELYLITPKYLKPYLSYIKRNKRLFLTAIKKAKVLQLNQSYSQLFQHVLMPILDCYQVPQEERKYIMSFYIQGIIAIITQWLKDDCKEEIEAIRELPQEDKQLKIFMKWRNPFNHMTVMFRKKDILAVGGYQPFYLLEDYYLWNRLANANYYFANIGESLLWARGGYTMLERRGGWKYVVSESKLLKFMYRSGRINIVEFGANLMMKSIIRLIGKHLRHTIYTFFLRKKVTKTSVSV